MRSISISIPVLALFSFSNKSSRDTRRRSEINLSDFKIRREGSSRCKLVAETLVSG